MRGKIAAVWVTGLLLSLSAAVLGQGPPPGMGSPGGIGGPGGFGGPPLVTVPSVQEDIGLTAKQKDQLKKLEASVDQKRRQVIASQGANNPDKFEIMWAMMQIRRDQKAAVAKILDKRQKDRIAQIELQRDGILAVGRRDIATKIKLTANQSRKIETITDDMQRTIAVALPRPPDGGFGPGPGGGSPGGDPPGDGGQARRNRGPDDNGVPRDEGGAGAGDRPGGERGGRRGDRFPGGVPRFKSEELRAQVAKARGTMEKARKEAAGKVNAVLTDTQKAAFQKLLGKPFDVSTIPAGPPPDGPGPRPGGGPPERGKGALRPNSEA